MKKLKKNAKDYESKFVKQYKESILAKGLVLREMEPDGNCLFRSVADQLYGDQSLHSHIRKYVVDYLVAEKEYFINFICLLSDENQKSSKKKKKNKNQQNNILSDQMKLNDNENIQNNQIETNEEIFDSYVKELSQNGTWGDDIEIQIISEIYKRSVEIYYAFEETPMRTFHEDQSQFQCDLPIRLSYHGKCHYNSIKSIHKERLISENIGVLEEQAIKRAHERQQAIKFISENSNSGNISQELQNLCRQKFELLQNYSNTEELYQRLIEEQYESSTFQNQDLANPPKEGEDGYLYFAEKYNLMNGPGNQELAFQLALEESRYMMEQQQGTNEPKQPEENNFDQNNHSQNDVQQQDPNLTNNNNQNITQDDLEKIVAINAVVNAGFSREQAEVAMQFVGPNEDLIVNYILENFM